MAAETYVAIREEDEAGDEFSLELYGVATNMPVLDLHVEWLTERISLWLTVDQARTIRDGLDEYLTAVHREAVRRERGSLS